MFIQSVNRMIRYLVIVCLIGYCFSLRLELLKKTNSFGHLYDTCNKTRAMIADLDSRMNIKSEMHRKLTYYRKNNDKLLYNYRVCTSALKTREEKSLIALISQ